MVIVDQVERPLLHESVRRRLHKAVKRRGVDNAVRCKRLMAHRPDPTNRKPISEGIPMSEVICTFEATD